jgi:hypothetical protein
MGSHLRLIVLPQCLAIDVPDADPCVDHYVILRQEVRHHNL